MDVGSLFCFVSKCGGFSNAMAKCGGFPGEISSILSNNKLSMTSGSSGLQLSNKLSTTGLDGPTNWDFSHPNRLYLPHL